MTESHILSIETSALDCSVSLGTNGKLQGALRSDGEWKHSREITILIKKLLDKENLSFDNLSGVAVSAGPGSYTGLRVGTSVAKAIAYAKNIPLIGIETLKIVAEEFREDAVKSKSRTIPVIDARRDEVYYQVFDHGLEALTQADNLIITPGCLDDWSGTDTIICGDAVEKARNILGKDNFDFRLSKPKAENMCRLAQEYFQNDRLEDTAYFTPFYLKSPNITKSKKPLF